MHETVLDAAADAGPCFQEYYQVQFKYIDIHRGASVKGKWMPPPRQVPCQPEVEEERYYFSSCKWECPPSVGTWLRHPPSLKPCSGGQYRNEPTALTIDELINIHGKGD